MITTKHYKFNYKPEISPKIFLEKMILSNKELNDMTSKRSSYQNNNYISFRNEIIILLKKINSTIENNSSTYYLSLYYIDNIFACQEFNNYINEYYKYKYQINSEMKKIYIILSVTCLIIATKFNENDPHFPGADTFLRLCNKFTDYAFYIQINDLVEGEVIILKLLKYKLSYYSTYNFLVFFFGHGIILENFFEKIEGEKKYERKTILEKIYILSREILDFLNSNNTNESIEILNKNNYITAIIILCYSIENILETKIDENAENDVFMGYYGLNIDNNIKKSIYDIIKNTYNNKSNKNNNDKKNNTFRYTYSAALFNNKKNKLNNYSIYSSYQKDYQDKINNNNNNYIVNTTKGNQTSNYNFIYNNNNNTNNTNLNNIKNNVNYNSHITYGNNRKVYLNYEKTDQIKNNSNNDKIYTTELRKSFSMNQLQNKISSTENNSNYPINDKNKLKDENEINHNSNSYYINNNKIESYKKNIFISDKDINNSKNYMFEELYGNKPHTNTNKYISLKKNISYNIKKDEEPILDNLNYYYDNIYKSNNKYHLKSIISTPNEPMTTMNTDREKLIQKNIKFSDYNINLHNVEIDNRNKKSKSKEKISLYDVIEKTKKIFNMNNNNYYDNNYNPYNKKKNTIIINNNININNYIDKNKYNNYFNQNNKINNLTSNNNYYQKLNMNKYNNKPYFDKKDLNKKTSFNYKINYDNIINNNNDDVNKFNTKTNRFNLNMNNLKNMNRNINTYYDYSNGLYNNININKDIMNSNRRFSYYKQSNEYYNLK